MALGDPYASLPEIKSRFGLTDLLDDDALEQALDAASRAVDRFARRQFNDAEATSLRRYRSTHSRLALVDDFSTADGLVVEVDGQAWNADDYELEPLDGVVDGEPGWPFWRIRAVDSTFPRSAQAVVKVTARWGWSVVPDPVRDVTEQLAAELFKLRDAPFGVAGFGEFGAVRLRENPKFKSMLAPYRRNSALVA